MNHKQRFKRQRNIIHTGFFFIGFFILLFIAGVSFLVYEIITLFTQVDWSNGLKGVIDTIWYGSKG